jgi:diguanylate cyclase (GGDEF)-like protein/PAS domain S-box-containing protein
MHKILWRQIKRLNIDPEVPPDLDAWKELLGHIDHTYAQADQDRYLLERSLAISSKETQDLYDEEQRRIKEALKISEGKYRSLFEHAVDSIFIIDAETRRILDVNQIASDRLGYSRAELLAMGIDELAPPYEMERVAELMEKLHRAGSLQFERTHIRKDGSLMPVEVSSILLEQDGRLVYQSIVRDITQRKATEKELQRLAKYDSLTGVANRVMFIDRVSHAIDLARRSQKGLAVIFIDLDGFKAVNDAFGHKHGDTLLQIIAQRISESVRKSDTVARLGGDEFAVLLEGISKSEDAAPIVEKIIASVAQPFSFRSAEAFITSSVGVSFFPIDGSDPDMLIQNADRAMYQSKAEEKNNYRFFTAAMKTAALERLELGNQLRHAIEKDEISTVFQAQVDSQTGRVFGVEALARWENPRYGTLLPERFVELAEETGLIVPISDWILETACSQVQAWFDRGVRQIRLSINLSGRDLNQLNLINRVERVLQKTGFPAHLLELELSENTIFRDLYKAQAVLVGLKKLGVRLAIDDFGTGYSTLIQLASFPFDTLKMDRQFASQITRSAPHAAIVNGIVTIARNLGMDVVAEGVEDQEQLEAFQSVGCRLIQGWLFSKPVLGEALTSLINDGVPINYPHAEVSH